MEDKMDIFQCQLCPVIFETYALAAGHLRTQHGLTVRTGSRCMRHEKLKKLTLPQLSVSMPRVADNLGKVSKQNDDKEVSNIVPVQTNPKKPRKSIHTVAKTKKGVEIKLDSLKASEIDTLMQDLYQNKKPAYKKPDVSASNEETETIPSSSRNRNSRRAAAKAACKVFVRIGEDEALDNHHEEPPNVRIRRKPAKFDDTDYRPYNYGANNSGGGNNVNTCDLIPSKRGRQESRTTNNDDNTEKKALLLYTCSTCPIQFSNKLDFARHEKNHQKSCIKNHACPLCYLKFAKKTSLQQHFILHLENNPYVCKLSGCGAKFGNYDHLRRHVQLHTGAKPFSCEYCSKPFARSDSLQKHLNTMHLNKVHRKWRHKLRDPRRSYPRVKLVTDLAPEAFLQDATTGTVAQPTKEEQDEIRLEVGSQHFIDHVIAKEDPKEHVESKTETTSSNYNISDDEEDDDDSDYSDPDKNNGMPKLTEISSDSNNPRRSVRSIILSDPVYLKLLQDNPTAAAEVVPQTNGYARGYNGEVRHEFKCTECGWSATRAFFFKQHMKKRHNKDTSLIPTPTSTSTSKEASVTTTTSTTTSVSLLCGSCGYQSPSADELSKHIRKEHQLTKKYSCSFCSIRFDSLDKVSHHEKVYHLAEKKFSCAKCPAKFTLSQSLQTHEKRTHGPRSSKNLEKCKCKICGSQLSTVLSLRTHMTNVHTSKLRVRCRICLQTCANKHVLKRHLRYVHLNMPNPYNKSLKTQINEAKTLKKTKQTANSQDPAAPSGNTTTSTTSEIHSPLTIDEQTNAETDLIVGI